jgi:hypothetical protein
MKMGRIQPWPISGNLVAIKGFRAKKLVTLTLEFEPVAPECRSDVSDRTKFPCFALTLFRILEEPL